MKLEKYRFKHLFLSKNDSKWSEKLKLKLSCNLAQIFKPTSYLFRLKNNS